MSTPVAEIVYRGEVQVRPYRHGTYLGDEYLDALIERALRERYGYGRGWSGYGEVTIRLYDEPERQPG